MKGAPREGFALDDSAKIYRLRHGKGTAFFLAAEKAGQIRFDSTLRLFEFLERMLSIAATGKEMPCDFLAFPRTAGHVGRVKTPHRFAEKSRACTSSFGVTLIARALASMRPQGAASFREWGTTSLLSG